MFASRPLIFVMLVISVLVEGLLLTVVSSSSDSVNIDDVEKLRPTLVKVHEGISQGISKRSVEHSTIFSDNFQGEDLSSCTKCGIINRRERTFMVIEEDFVDPPYMYPWMTRLRILQKNNKTSTCGGSIIDAKYILTAAHCFPKDAGPKGVKILLLTNTTALVSGPEVQEIILHPEYKTSGGGHDIALLKLKNKIICDTFKNPVCLPPPNMKIPDGTVTTIAGWGRTKPTGTPDFNRHLREGMVKIVNYEKCARTYKRQTYMAKIEYCSEELEEKWQSVCYGDSGGPSFYERGGKYYQVGITSSAVRGCLKGYPFMFTAVPSYVNWIKQVMGKRSF